MTNLLETTKALLIAMDEPREAAAKRWGVSSRWIRSVLSGDIENPGVVTVQRIHDDLISRRPRMKSAKSGRKN